MHVPIGVRGTVVENPGRMVVARLDEASIEVHFVPALERCGLALGQIGLHRKGGFRQSKGRFVVGCSHGPSMPTFARRRPSSSECWYDSSLSRLTYAHNAREWTRVERPGYVSNRARCRLNWVPRLRIIAGCERKSMSLRKVTLFDKEGSAVEPTDEDGQAKPAVLGVRWVNPH